MKRNPTKNLCYPEEPVNLNLNVFYGIMLPNAMGNDL